MEKFGAKIHDYLQPKSTTPLEQQPPKTNDYLAADAGGTRQHWVQPGAKDVGKVSAGISSDRINKHQPVKTSAPPGLLFWPLAEPTHVIAFGTSTWPDHPDVVNEPVTSLTSYE